jgi:hypothetical protein
MSLRSSEIRCPIACCRSSSESLTTGQVLTADRCTLNGELIEYGSKGTKMSRTLKTFSSLALAIFLESPTIVTAQTLVSVHGPAEICTWLGTGQNSGLAVGFINPGTTSKGFYCALTGNIGGANSSNIAFMTLRMRGDPNSPQTNFSTARLCYSNRGSIDSSQYSCGSMLQTSSASDQDLILPPPSGSFTSDYVILLDVTLSKNGGLLKSVLIYRN